MRNIKKYLLLTPEEVKAAKAAYFNAVKEAVTAIVKRELAPIAVVEVNMREDISVCDGDPIYRIDIVFDGARPSGEQASSTLLKLREYLWDMDDERFPLITFIDAPKKRARPADKKAVC